MKLEIYGKPAPKEEPPVRLRLVRALDGAIMLEAVDEGGSRVFAGNLLYFSETGRIIRQRGVSPDLGFDLDEQGCIKMGDEE
ncbi:MAG: hypothetical protein ABFD89_12660 [Bryobacteraceae bacterium]